VPNLDLLRRVAHCVGGVLEEHLLLRAGHEPEELPWLRIIIVVFAMIPVVRGSFERERRL
jgi:hypothetical protein